MAMMGVMWQVVRNTVRHQWTSSLLLIGILFEFLVVSIIKNLQFLLNCCPLPATNRARAGVFLLFLHLPQDCLLLHLNERATFLLTQTEPEFLDALTLLVRRSIPYAIFLGDAIARVCHCPVLLSSTLLTAIDTTSAITIPSTLLLLFLILLLAGCWLGRVGLRWCSPIRVSVVVRRFLVRVILGIR